MEIIVLCLSEMQNNYDSFHALNAYVVTYRGEHEAARYSYSMEFRCLNIKKIFFLGYPQGVIPGIGARDSELRQTYS